MANQQLAFDAFSTPAASAPRPAQAGTAAAALAAVPAAKPSAAPAASCEWLCVYLPQLASEVLAGQATNPELLVVSEAQQGRPVVHNATMAAIQRGIYPGVSLPTAYTLCDGIDVQPRNTEKERQRLQQLAACLYQFSSQLSLQPPNKLLLEIAASYSLFGGRRPLLAQLNAALKQQGHRAKLATAATPKAAEWLAEWQGPEAETELELEPAVAGRSLRQRLNGLPLSALNHRATAKLRQLGCRNIGDVLRLPRAGLARRFGPALLLELDQALGNRPDPRKHYRPPLHFNEALELPSELDSLKQFWPGVQQLLTQLQGFLRDCNHSTRWLQLDLQHAEQPPTLVELQLLRATASYKRLEPLLHGRLERLQLAAPVRGLRLQLKQLQPSRPTTSDPLNHCHSDDENWLETLERLQLRLGADRVSGLALHNSHQPEAAWQRCPPGAAAHSAGPAGGASNAGQNPVASGVTSCRPSWLLATPRKLSQTEQQTLRFVGSSERIADNWWEAGESSHAPHGRDYIIAIQPNGLRLWVYRHAQQLYCHGIYG